MSEFDTSYSDQFTQPTDEVDVYVPGEKYIPFGISRGGFSGEPLIEFIDKTGKRHAKPWSQLDDIIFDASTGIEIKFANVRVTLVGRNLNNTEAPKGGLYAQLLRQRVTYIREANRTDDFDPPEDEETIITEMAIADRYPSLSES